MYLVCRLLLEKKKKIPTTQSLRLHVPSLFPPLTHPPPTPTLFPYTTLFRSQVANQVSFRCEFHLWVGPLFRELSASMLAEYLGSGTTCPPHLIDHFQQEMKDRKSTRLNSSHRCISYAVFCLKKKKKYQQHRVYASMCLPFFLH